jgi:RNA polymerase sigma factor (sigma-70 family)
MDDFELLQTYATRRAEDAFSTLTGRYINLVYSAAARQTSNAQTAEDITQAVFLTLARKAGSISQDTILSGWLLRTTRFAAANARRLEQRRQHYEQEAMHSYICPTESEVTWQRIAPLLDESLDRLGDKDRDAIVLRFFEQKSLKQIADKLGVSEDGAQKRVSRALEKLRLAFVRQGKSMSASVLAGTIAANSVQAVSPALSASICAAVGSQSLVASSGIAVLADATIKTLSRIRLQSMVVRGGSVAIVIGLALLTTIQLNNSLTNISRQSPKPLQPTANPAAQIKSPSPSIPVAATQTEAGKLLLRVLDAQSGLAVTNARLSLVSIIEFPRRSTNISYTDAQGNSPVSYSSVAVKHWSHRIEVFQDGYVPKYVSWSETQGDQIDEIPAECTVKVDRAVTIGGSVIDEQSAPVPGMRVVFSVMGPTDSQSRERLTTMGNYHTEVTDAAGRWTCSHVPTRFGMIQYRLVHPQFQETTYVADSPDAPNYTSVDRIPEADLLAGRAVMRAKPGLIIAGNVTDESGSPVSGAKVTQKFDFYHAERNTITQPNGSFRFGNARTGEMSLTVQAAGLAPVVTSFVMNASAENLGFTLPVGRTLLGRVVDELDQPIIGATIQPVSASGDSQTPFQWHADTDGDGKFKSDAAPVGQDYAVHAPGYQSQSRINLAAAGTEQVIRLQKANELGSIKIAGRIVDAETKLAPASATIQIWQTTRETRGNSSSFVTSTTRPQNALADGRFRFKTSSTTVRYILEAQAEGYAPTRLTNEVTGASDVEFTIKLKKAPLLAGIVLTPGGEPAAGATLAVCSPDERAQMTQPGKIQGCRRSQGRLRGNANCSSDFEHAHFTARLGPN